jgi:hypothetical protein
MQENPFFMKKNMFSHRFFVKTNDCLTGKGLGLPGRGNPPATLLNLIK